MTQLEVPTDDAPPKQAHSWKRIVDPSIVTDRIFERNTKHFGSAHGTPFTIPPLSEDFDWAATSPGHRNTLNGSSLQYGNDLIDKLLTHTSTVFAETQETTPYITMPQLLK